MNSDVKIPTAKIYQFPARAPKVPGPSAKVVAKVVPGGCWYHDEAIRSEPKPIRPLNGKPGH
jgi:Protein of unknown function (DUF2735)